MVTRLIIWRHGETTWNASRRVQGTADIALSAEGDPGEPPQGAGAVALIVDGASVATVEPTSYPFSEPAFVSSAWALLGPLGQDASGIIAGMRIGANLAGLPALSVPCGFVRDLPVGLQIVGPHFSEAKLLAAAHALQRETDWHRQIPRLWL